MPKTEIEIVPTTNITKLFPRTQKAKGVRTIHLLGEDYNVLDGTPAWLVQNEDNVDLALSQYRYIFPTTPAFARPCPMNPRHGFEDSVVVRSADEVRDVYKRTAALDPEGEVMLMPYVESKASAVVTPSSLTIGRGNDGATAGRKVKVIRLVPEKQPSLYTEPYALKSAGIEPSDSPYIEVVLPKFSLMNRRYARLTQIRGGPAIPPTFDYVPSRIKVKRIVTIRKEIPLLEWEALVKSFGEGTVVQHPSGSLSSHYGVHCVINHVPYLTTFKVKRGQWLEQVSEVEESMDIGELRRGIMEGMELDRMGKEAGVYSSIHTMNAATVYAMMHIHNFAAEHGTYGSHAIGVSAALLYRLITVLCCGEYRHGVRVRKYSDAPPSDRNTVYIEHWLGRRYVGSGKTVETDHANTHAMLASSAYSFMSDPWSSSYGGPLWGSCAIAGLQLWDAMRAVMEPSSGEDEAKVLLEAANRAANGAHNGGWCFGKFFESDSYRIYHRFNADQVMHYASKMDRGFVALAAFPSLHTIWAKIEAIKDVVNPFDAPTVKSLQSWEALVGTEPIQVAAEIVAGKIVGRMEADARLGLDKLRKSTKGCGGNVCVQCGSCPECGTCACDQDDYEESETSDDDSTVAPSMIQAASTMHPKTFFSRLENVQFCLRPGQIVHVQATLKGWPKASYMRADVKVTTLAKWHKITKLFNAACKDPEAVGASLAGSDTPYVKAKLLYLYGTVATVILFTTPMTSIGIFRDELLNKKGLKSE